ncbi:A/G-specific adenine glycosylase [Caldifermentibacillus hisashii]|uniref:Adenine DNA glycosylase n=1 Tax=Caldifermentibacillus hisashii TaxID=996558 RepID=A0ABU9JXT1_9BACI|nr:MULTISPECIES: A/G-specific adenine glycosylase [Bacillaceae]MCM3478001.1 A/G-specific adenine glycosylase [Caldibacillus thermoamylovorans]MDL0419503.1 A/G-specific adenine glycosylase [Caldibacillus thermoamylovorans]NWN98905.1 A/G-specific adenine glycosylase [Bacillus sp. (in: firmicutes)]PAC36765.1 A/G-specific adenine glycosylase [Caldifermentibacillus hisashii]
MNERVSVLLKNFNIEEFQKSLIEWFQEEKRNLPWRADKDPYKIWVSEVMLQQTRVDTVIPYFYRFIEKYPNIEALANADEQELLKTWEGLGYYSRVKNLQAAVKEVQTQYGGVVPDEKKTFSKLKGVGPYTTGAVLSIAYNKPIPAVDGNVMRVLSRIFEIEDDIIKVRTRKLFEELVEEIISREDPSSFNQGLMELGALICKPTSPDCLLCPVRDHCRAFQHGTETRLPVKSKQKKGRTVQYVAAILLDERGKVVIRKRPDEGLLASLWEFPNEEVISGKKNMIIDFENEWLDKYGANVDLLEPLCVVEHVFSHLTWKIHAFVGLVKGELPQNMKVVAFEEVDEYPFPVPYQKMWKEYKKKIAI